MLVPAKIFLEGHTEYLQMADGCGERCRNTNTRITIRRKFSARFRGPFVVTRRKGVVYEISDGVHRPRWIHHDELCPWHENVRLWPAESVPTAPRVNVDGESVTELAGSSPGG